MVAEQKAGLRKFYDAQVAEHEQKKRLERERQKEFAKEQEKELETWQKVCDSQIVKRKEKFLAEKALRDEQVVRAQDRKLASLEQDVRYHMQLMDRMRQEGESAKQVATAQASQRSEFFYSTQAEAMRLTSTRKNFRQQQRSEEASAMATYTSHLKQYEDYLRGKGQAKVESHKLESAQQRKDRAQAATGSRQAAMKLDMEQLHARTSDLDRQERERLLKAKELRTTTHEFIQKQIAEKKEQKQKEREQLREVPKPMPSDGGFGMSQKLVSRDLTTAHAWDFARSEEEVAAQNREQRLKHRKELEAQISARGRTFPGLNTHQPQVEPTLSPKEMALNRKVVDEVLRQTM